MKKIIIAILLAVSMNSFAASSADCKTHSTVAAGIMSARQSGVPITRVIHLIETEKDFPADFKEQLRHMTKMAYELPRYKSKEFRDETEVDFANKIFLLCERYNK